jgi:beta-lactam-binding protein with PASTA domain
VSGQTQQQATRTLQAAGFNVKVRAQQVTDPAQNGKVLHQYPAPPRKFQKGKTIRLYVGQFQQPTGTTGPGAPAEPVPPGQ